MREILDEPVEDNLLQTNTKPTSLGIYMGIHSQPIAFGLKSLALRSVSNPL